MEIQKVKGLKVGIVSTIEHVTTLMNELKVHGHTAVPLPELGDRYKIPTSCDVIVCRVDGTSHRAVSMCLEEARRNIRPVIFRNGTTRIMEKIHAAASGTWVQDSILPWANTTMTKDIEDLEPEELAAMKEEEERVRESTTCADYIRQLIEKGGAFHEGLLSLEPVAAKEVLCSVKYSSRDRVKRTAVLHLVDSLKKVRPKVVADQVEGLLAEGVQSETIWWTSAKASGAVQGEIVLHAGWNAQQLNQYVNALDSRFESIHYAVNKSDLVKPPEEVFVEEPMVEVVVT
ncbi:MAG: hypothetical protein EBU84_21920, partial [Actinobacteria bacterium]|nr:hypothetical protein [Actinomycetota bacterium]